MKVRKFLKVLTAAVVPPVPHFAKRSQPEFSFLNTITDWLVRVISGFHCCVNEISYLGVLRRVECSFLWTFRDYT
jgi:hypothetical protein